MNLGWLKFIVSVFVFTFNFKCSTVDFSPLFLRPYLSTFSISQPRLSDVTDYLPWNAVWRCPINLPGSKIPCWCRFMFLHFRHFFLFLFSLFRLFSFFFTIMECTAELRLIQSSHFNSLALWLISARYWTLWLSATRLSWMMNSWIKQINKLLA